MATPQPDLEGDLLLVSQCLSRLPRAEKIKALRSCRNTKHGLDLVQLLQKPGVVPLGHDKFQTHVRPGNQKHFDFHSVFKKKPQKPDNRYMRFLMSIRTHHFSEDLNVKAFVRRARQRSRPAASQQKSTPRNSNPNPRTPLSRGQPKAWSNHTHARNPATRQGAAAQRLLRTSPAGPRGQEVKEGARSCHGLDLGYRDTPRLLQQAPNVRVSTPAKGARSLVTSRKEAGGEPGRTFSCPSSSPPGDRQPKESQRPVFTGWMALTEPRGEILRLVRQSLRKKPGLRIKKLKAVLGKLHGLDLERVSRDLGYGSALRFLQEAPDIELSDPAKKRNCLVRIKKGRSIITSPWLFSNQPNGKASAHTPQPQSVPLDLPPRPPVDQTLLSAPSAPGHDTMVHQSLHMDSLGRKDRKLKKVLWTPLKVDVTVRCNLSYEDTLSFLQEAPNVQPPDPAKGNTCVVQLKKTHLSSPPPQIHLSRPPQNHHAGKPEETESCTEAPQQKPIKWEESKAKGPEDLKGKPRHEPQCPSPTPSLPSSSSDHLLSKVQDAKSNAPEWPTSSTLPERQLPNEHQDTDQPACASVNNTEQIIEPSRPPSPRGPSDQLYFTIPEIPPVTSASRQLCPVSLPNQRVVGKDAHLSSTGALQELLPTPDWVQFSVTYPVVSVSSPAYVLLPLPTSSVIQVNQAKDATQESQPSDIPQDNCSRYMPQDNQPSDRAQDDCPSSTAPEGCPSDTTQESHPSDIPQDNCSRYMPQDNQPSDRAQDDCPSSTAPEGCPSDTTQESHPSDIPQDNCSRYMPQDNQPSDRAQDDCPSSTAPEGCPSDTTQESHPSDIPQDNCSRYMPQHNQPSDRAQDDCPSSTAPEGCPSDTTQESQPSDIPQDNCSRYMPQDNQPSDRAQDDCPSSTAPEGCPSDTTQESHPSDIPQDNCSRYMPQDNQPSDRAQDDCPSSTAPEGCPSDTTQESHPSDIPQDNCSRYMPQDNQPSDRAQDDCPSSTAPEGCPSDTTQESHPSDIPQDNCSRYMPQDNQPSDKAQDDCPSSTAPEGCPSDTTQESQPSSKILDPSVMLQGNCPRDAAHGNQPSNTPQKNQLANAEPIVACSETPSMNSKKFQKTAAGLKEETSHLLPRQGASRASSSPEQPAGQAMEARPAIRPPSLRQDRPPEASQTTRARKHLPATWSSSSQWPSQGLPPNTVTTVQLPHVLVPRSVPFSSPAVPSGRPPHGSRPVITGWLPLPTPPPNQPLGNSQLTYLSSQQPRAPMPGIRIRNAMPVPGRGSLAPPWLPKPTAWLPGAAFNVGLAGPPTAPATADTTRLELPKAKEPSRCKPAGELAKNRPSGYKEEPGFLLSSSLSVPTSAPGQSLRKPQEVRPKTTAPSIPPNPAATPLDQKTIPGLDRIRDLLSLPRFASGVSIEKLKVILKKECSMDLENLWKDLGCKDTISLLQRVPNIILLDPGKSDRSVAKFQKDSQNGPKASCPGQNVSGPTPSPGQPTEKPLTKGQEGPAPTWSPNAAGAHMVQNTTSHTTENNCAPVPPQEPSQCPKRHHDPILKEEVLVALLQKPQGVTFGQFAGVFHQTHGYQLKLSRHGYNSLQSLLNDMKDLVVVLGAGTQDPLIRCRFPSHHRLVEIFPTGPKGGIS
ncbi:nascent polypeptide-associated complex subunit alpha, muscle-specific form-like isoform X2 [Rhinatrema bivittatum]|uniref:nascent polypeptide-associated complex subunit alpha, muscle-specific form-like isoform X2 n=1 Tax=Rhinatrema bivittatum TaxID=194408 RepID=UPI00112DB7DA|nr:nascent polypeptide-associated complex subunit alpha, muscle-specific form-like isoform X2 [Rhinatrema bivittatum]